MSHVSSTMESRISTLTGTQPVLPARLEAAQRTIKVNKVCD